MPTIDVIVPIYRGLEELKRCLFSVVENPQQVDYELLLINDASPEPEIGHFLSKFAADFPRVTLLENEENLGFVGTVNRGMSFHPDRDVILLNSDTEVANDWLDRIAAAAYSSEDIGTVTPFSSNATICSFPVFCKSNPLPQNWPLAELDALFAEVNKGELVEIPTAVGFCQYIKRDCLAQTGLFDEERFGKGYGEENDFCMRAARKGWRHVLCCDTFVFHEGGVSFSSEQEERVNRAQEILDRLYPDYHQTVQQHVKDNPAEPQRLRVLLEMLRRSPRHKVLFVTHHLGGGTRKHMAELADHLQHEMDVLVITPAEGNVISLALGTEGDAQKIYFSLPDDYPELLRLLRYCAVSRVHFHHTLGVETSVWGVPQDLDVPFDVTLHDYYFINANPTQTDARGCYTADLDAQSGSYALPVSLQLWQENQHRLLSAAQRVIAPSHYTAQLFAEHFPDVRCTVAYHPDSEQDRPYPPVQPPTIGERPLKVLALGALSLEKGADILEAAAVEAGKTAAPLEFHLLGYAYRPLSAAVKEHGAYDEAEVENLIRELAPDLVWFPALWPETYSYTLSEVLRIGLPLVAPDQGAFPERLTGRPLTWVCRWDQTAGDWVGFFTALRAELMQTRGEMTPLVWANQPIVSENPDFYSRDYLRDNDSLPASDVEAVTQEWLKTVLGVSRERHAGETSLTRKEELLLRLVDLRQGVIGRTVSRLVPVSLQRSIKRKLSRKPLHEIKK